MVEDFNEDPLMFTLEERAILDSSPDWYTELLNRWAKLHELMIPEMYTDLEAFKRLRTENPKLFNIYKGALENYCAPRQEFIDAVKRKFIAEGYSEEAAERIAGNQITANKMSNASTGQSLVQAFDSMREKKKIEEDFDQP